MITELTKFMKSERGNVESAMVLIPLLFLFLCGAQLTSAVFIRNLELGKVQSEASIRAISHDLEPQDSIFTIETGNRFDSSQLLIVRKKREIPIIVPGLSKMLGGALFSSVTGVAVMESNL